MKAIPILLLLILSFSFCIAQPPFQQSSNIIEGYDLESPIIEYIRLNENFTFHMHVYNASSGFRLTNESAACYLHLYSGETGNHLVQQQMIFDENDIDFELKVLGGNFSEPGQYAVLMDCIYPPEEVGGFIEFPFYVTEGGSEWTLADSLVRIFLVLFFVGLIAALWISTRGIDFAAWEKRIINDYVEQAKKNFIKFVLQSMAYNVLKNKFIIYYLLGFPIILTILDISTIYNIASLTPLLQVLLMLYTVGSLVVGLLFFGFVQVWIMKTWDIVKDMDWGVGGK